MSGGLLQLVAKGVEDIFITGDPQISMFQTIFRRYSNFSMETIDIPVTGKQTFGSEISSKLPKRGDVLGKIYLGITLPEIIPVINKQLFELVNEIFNQFDIPEYLPADVITVQDALQRIDNKIEQFNNKIGFLKDIITQIETTSDIQDNNQVTLYNKIAESIQKFATGNDIGLLYIYKAVIDGSLAKVESDGTYDITTFPDLTGYKVSLSNLESNKTKGRSQVIMTTDEIVKAMYANIYQFLFGSNPSELRFIQTVYTIVPDANSFGDVTLSSRLIDIFTTFFNVQNINQADITSDVDIKLQAGIDSVDALLDTPFFIKYNITLNMPNVLYKFNDIDGYRYMQYYMNLKGPTVQDMLNNLSISQTDINTIKATLTNIIYPDFRNLLWADIVKNFLLNANTFITLDQNNGNLVLVKREDYTDSSGNVFKGDILEYTDFFYGPTILPCISLSPTSNSPVWANPNLPADTYWDNFTWQQVRQAIQDPSYFTVNPLPGIFLLQYPQIASLTPVSNVSSGFVNLTYLNNYNLYLDSIVQTYYKQQHLALLQGEINDTITIDSAFRDPIFTPVSLQYWLGLNTTNPTYNVFRSAAPGNNELQNNYYKSFSVAPDVDPRMFRIRYMNGSVVVMFMYIQQQINNLLATNMASFPIAEYNAINSTLTNVNEQLSAMMIEALFPRIDKTLPYGPTNDRAYILFTTMLNSIPTGVAGFSDQTTVNTNVTFALSIFPGFTLSTVPLYDLYRYVYYPFTPSTPVDFSLIPQFLTTNIFWKTDNINGEEVFFVYIEQLQKLYDNNPSFSDFTKTFLTTLINNLGMLKTLYVQTCVNKLSIILGNVDGLFKNNKCDFSTIFQPSKYINPIVNGVTYYFFCTQLIRSALSNEFGFAEAWDSYMQACPQTPDLPFIGFQPVPVPFLTYSTFLDGLYYNLTNDFLQGSSIWYNIYCHQKFNYNYLYGGNILNKENVTQYVGSSSGTRIDNHVKNLVTNYNNQVSTYNNYVIANTPANFIPILKEKMITGIDFTQFGTLPTDIVTNLYDYSFVRWIRWEIDSAPVTDYAYINNFIVGTIGLYSYPAITPAIAQSLIDQLLLGPSIEQRYIQRILDEIAGRSNTLTINDLINYQQQLLGHSLEEYFNIRFDLEIFANNFSVYNWKKNLNDLTFFPPPPNNLFFTSSNDIKQYYITTMINTNTLFLNIYVYPNVPTLYGFILADGSLAGLTFSFGVDRIEGNFLETFFYFINQNFYTIGELWQYYNTQSANYITGLMLPNQAQLLALNSKFWASINPLNMYSNLDQIQKDYPLGFRFTKQYLTFVVQNIFANISFIGQDLSKNILFTDLTSTKYPSLELIVQSYKTELGKTVESNCKLENTRNKISTLILSATKQQIIQSNFAWVEKIGHVIQEHVLFDIGGEEYEKITDDWFEINYHLMRNIGQDRGYNKLIGNVSELTTFSTYKAPYHLTIPIPLWFTKYSNYHIPMFLCSYQELLLKIKIRKFIDLCYFEEGTKFKKQGKNGLIDIIPVPKYNIHAEYIYLDKDERRKLATTHNEMLYDHVHNNSEYCFSRDNIETPLSIRLTFNNNCKFIVWTCTTGQSELDKKWVRYGWSPIDYDPIIDQSIKLTNFNYTDRGTSLERKSIFSSIKIRFNGLDRIKEFEDIYFEYIQPYSYSNGLLPEGAQMYCFCLSVGMMQPSGSVNASKIDDFTMLFTINPDFLQIMENCGEYFRLKIYVVSYNIMRFLSGLCGRAFLMS